MKKRTLFSTLTGNVLEYFDFVLFAYFNPILAPIFFPHTEKHLAAIMTLGLFAVSFFMRPIGAIIFGKLGDNKGRKYTLSRSIVWISAPTFLIGCMPTFAHIGIWAPLGLLACRCIQGIAVGGEYCNAGIFLMESAPKKIRGFYSSLLSASGSVGSLLALICVYGVLGLDHPLAWRLPFLMSPLLGIFGYYLRQHTAESPEYLKMQAQPQKTQDAGTRSFSFFYNWQTFGLTASTSALVGALIWLPSTYTHYYLTHIGHFTLEKALPFTALALLFHALFSPLAGRLADKYSYTTLMTLGALGTMLAAYPLFYCLVSGYALIAQCGFMFLACIFGASVHAMLIDMYPIKNRCSGISFAFMLGSSLGSTISIINAFLIDLTGNHTAPALYLIVLALHWHLWQFIGKKTQGHLNA